MGKALETANRFYEITDRLRGSGLEDVITQDMTFVGPLMKFNGAQEYIQSTKEFLQMHRATRMHAQFENGNNVCSIYEMDIATPAGGMLTLEIVDLLRVTDGKVSSQKIIYDPREFAKAFGLG